METDFFGEKIRREGEFLIYHDESEPQANKGWLLIGLLFVNLKKYSNVLDVLSYHRKQENYSGEIHFCELPKSFNGEFGTKARVAKAWINAYQNGLFQDAHFSCLAVNRSSPRFEHKRFSENYHVYNRFTAMAIKAGISWMLAPYGFDQIVLTLVSDGKDRKSSPDQGLIDNFESYIPYRVEMDSLVKRLFENQSYPFVTMNPVRIVRSDQDDLLQLTDILLGATQSALVKSSIRPTKIYLASRITAWYQDLQKPQKQQFYRMHRKFDLWGFPDDQGRPFNRFSLSCSTSDQQLTLF